MANVDHIMLFKAEERACQMEPYSICSTLLLTRALKVVHYVGNGVPFQMQTWNGYTLEDNG